MNEAMKGLIQLYRAFLKRLVFSAFAGLIVALTYMLILLLFAFTGQQREWSDSSFVLVTGFYVFFVASCFGLIAVLLLEALKRFLKIQSYALEPYGVVCLAAALSLLFAFIQMEIHNLGSQIILVTLLSTTLSIAPVVKLYRKFFQKI